MHTVILAHDTDWPGFRAWARALVAQGVLPTSVHWRVARPLEPDLFSGNDEPVSPPAIDAASVPRVPAQFVSLCETVVLHSDPHRFALLYDLLWRLAHQPGFRDDVLDANVVRARLMAHAVHRDLHKMKAFVRFRELPGERFVAWFEPEHHIVDAVAPFFVRRFTSMRWAIATPRGSIAWDGHMLECGPAATEPPADHHDAHEGLWLTYYAHIFNPARLKLKAMSKEMPRKYWHNLPEARLIQPLSAQAGQRSQAMIERSRAGPD